MADIDLYQYDGDENADDAYALDDSLGCKEPFGADDNLTALQKLEKYVDSENVYTRQMIAKGIVDTLRAVRDSEEHTTTVLTALVKLSNDLDPMVRSELMEQMAHMAVYCHENTDQFHDAIPVYVLPIIVRYLNDNNNQVRKTSQAALLVLLEQHLVTIEQIEEQVVGTILDLANSDSLDDYRTEAVALMSKMAPLLGKEMTEKVFLSRFCDMCTDQLFHVRKVCAANFGEFFSVVSQKSAEQKLLPKLYCLCEDSVWGVRKACVECFMAVSCACSPEVRRSNLASLFVNLLNDLSKWVRMAAFQQLGPFISTFADSNATGMYVEDGTLVFKHHNFKARQLQRDKQVLGTFVSEIVDSDNSTCVPDGTPVVGVADSVKANESCGDRIVNITQIEMDICEDFEVTENTEPLQNKSNTVDTFSENRAQSEFIDNIVVWNDEQSLEEIRAKFYLNKQTTCKSNREIPDSGESKVENIGSENSTFVKNSVSEEVNVDIDDVDDIKLMGDSTNVILSDINNITDATLPSVTDWSDQKHDVCLNLDKSCDEYFDSFLFWQIPLPTVEPVLDFGINSKSDLYVENSLDLVANSDPYTATSDLSMALSETLSDLTVCDNQCISSMMPSHTNTGQSGGTSLSSRCRYTETSAEAQYQEIFKPSDSETSGTVIGGVVQDINSNNMAYMDSDFNSISPTNFREMVFLDNAMLVQQPNIVPQSLLENYVGMVDPSRAQTVDDEITKYCAYNFPAVAYTLGRENWHCIKNLYETLAVDMQWKVRRTLAFSIHQLAGILGEEITHRDLVPVFDCFLKDLDEVRIGLLRHLAEFLKLLHPNVRRQYLLKVQDFMIVDNNRNWRFRLELAEQLVLVSELFSAQEIADYLLLIAIELAEDKVAEVRSNAFHLISVLLKIMVNSQDKKLGQQLVSQLIERFALNKKWACRQNYTLLCQALIHEDAVDPLQFAKDFLPSLLSLCNDSVPNVRIALAKALTSYMRNDDFYRFEMHPCHNQVEETLKRLQDDRDRDVRYFCSPQSYLDQMSIHDDMSGICEYSEY